MQLPPLVTEFVLKYMALAKVFEALTVPLADSPDRLVPTLECEHGLAAALAELHAATAAMTPAKIAARAGSACGVLLTLTAAGQGGAARWRSGESIKSANIQALYAAVNAAVEEAVNAAA